MRGSGSRFGQLARRSPEETDLWCRQFEDLCRERGVRVTAQRLAVYRVLASDTSHPTADTVHALLRQHMSSLSQATVYRILQFLENEGLVRRVSTTDGPGRFDANITRHQHLVCRRCGSMRDCDERRLSLLSLPKPSVRGFIPEELDIRIIGVCEECVGQPGKAGPGKTKPDARMRKLHQ